MSLEDVRGPVEYWRKLARTSGGMQPPDIDVAVADAEALVELADAARDARNELRAIEEWSRSNGYQHDAAMQREVVDAIDAALARLDGNSGGAA